MDFKPLFTFNPTMDFEALIAMKEQRKALDPLKEPISKQTDVGLEITKQLLQTELKDKNMVYSPRSIHIVLSMIAARETGRTHDQYLSVLKSKIIDELNSLAANIVDGSATLGPYTSNFQATWYSEYYDESETRGCVFPSEGSTFHDPYQAGDEDYMDGLHFSMCLLLPEAIDGLPALTDRVCSEPGFMDEHLGSWESVEVDKFLIPKFKISTAFEASDVIEETRDSGA